MSRELTVTNTEQKALSAFANTQSFEQAQRMANALAASDLVPSNYKGNIANCLVALEVAQRTGSSVLAVTQNLHVIQGRPSWSSSYIIAALNSCGRFSPLRFAISDAGVKEVEYTTWEGEKGNRQKKIGKLKIADKVCVAWTLDSSGERLEGPPVSIEMAVLEGWYTKNDSKWKTMPDLMLRYRAAAFFGRLYAPDVLMGMQSEDEVRDVTPAVEATVIKTSTNTTQALNERIKSKKAKPKIDSTDNNDVSAAVVAEAEPLVQDNASFEEVSVEVETKPEGDFF